MSGESVCSDVSAFREKLLSLSFTFRGGGGYGRKNFHERTNAEFIREHVGEDDVKSGRAVRADPR